MSLSYLSVCSGIEAATVAWHPLGWKPWGFSEIERFPCAVLKHHYPDVPNYGDMTKFEEWPDETIDLLVGGTPCQSFSVAGLRKGLSDPRGNLMLTFGGIARRYRPRWLVWENVPGVLSSNGGRDFGTFLGMLAELGYGFAYRVLDAQYFGVAQRRRRVFVVGYFGDWRPAAAVLFERDSLQGNPAPRREAGQGVAGTFKAGAGSGGWSNSIDHAAGGYMQVQSFTAGGIAEYKEGIGTLRASGGDLGGGSETLIASTGNVSHCLNGGGMGRQDYGTETLITAFHPTQEPITSTNGTTHALSCGSSSGQASCAVAITLRVREGGATAEIGDSIQNALRASGGGGDKAHVLTSMSVRRMTPRECERLQGFPDDYTAIPYRGKAAADSPRCKALGNSMAVPVMRWIGERINQVEKVVAVAA